MTVTYSATRSFLLLLFQWKGSVWKAVSWQYLIYLGIYYSINFLYRYVLSADQQTTFEHMVVYFKEGNRFIPVQFLLGFYVSLVISNWWNQLNCISWPDKFLIFVASNVHGMDDKSRAMRRTLARFVNLTNVLLWKEISLKIKRRFPTNDHIVKAGLMTEHEKKVLEGTPKLYTTWFVPISWTANLLSRCREEGRISDYAHQKMVEELWAFRSGSGMLTIYDWMNIPLVYTQVVTLATYGYFALALVGRQFLKYDGAYKLPFQLYFPLFTTLEFLFYIGWLMVGEQLRCPLGEDDDDFDMNYVVDRNVYVSYLLVDELYSQKMEPTKDEFWDIREPVIPHTRGSYQCRDRIPPWRIEDFKVRDEETIEWNQRMQELRKKKIVKKIESWKSKALERSTKVETLKL